MTERSEDQTQNVSGKAVIVTGGTTGIGRATARMLASRGARVLIFGRHQEDLDSALEEIRQAGGEVHGLTADQSKKEDIQRVFDEADRSLKGLDILVNNAAIAPDGVEEAEPDEIQYAINTNLFGYLACAHEAVKRMKKRGEGHIINIGSMSADRREEEAGVYVATKAAIQAFSESLRKSVNPVGIKVSLIEPGKVATDMVDASDREKRKREEKLEMLKPEDIAECVHFCLVQPKRCDIVGMQVRPHLQVI